MVLFESCRFQVNNIAHLYLQVGLKAAGDDIMSRCHCASDPTARHGPYYEWSHLKAGKLRHRTLSPEQAGLMRLAIANHRKVKKLLRAWEAQTQRLIDLNAPE